jgi:hypothetical protein
LGSKGITILLDILIEDYIEIKICEDILSLLVTDLRATFGAELLDLTTGSPEVEGVKTDGDVKNGHYNGLLSIIRQIPLSGESTKIMSQ